MIHSRLGSRRKSGENFLIEKVGVLSRNGCTSRAGKIHTLPTCNKVEGNRNRKTNALIKANFIHV